MILLCDHITARLQYITAWTGEWLWGKPLLLTTDVQSYRDYPGAKINYTSQPVAEPEIHIYPAGLLAETGIRQQALQPLRAKGVTVFFPTPGPLGSDIFAEAFYLLSRYEEYLPHTKDLYGRYACTQSLAYKEGFLNQPLVNQKAEALRTLIRQRFPEQALQQPQFRLLPTYDIDEAFAIRHKGALHAAGSLLRDLVRGKNEAYRYRRNVLKGLLPDPYDSFAMLDALHQQYKLEPLYFFLLAADRKGVDRNISPANPVMQALISRHAERYATGIHPSWQSGDDPKLLRQEIETLETITGRSVTRSRQHFLRFTLPEGYRRLVQAGITEDYSMGYGEINGFRASVASPFYWYDLVQESVTGLRIFPFCYMDANSFFEQAYTPGQALEEMRYYREQVKQVNGLLITLWHNSFLGTDPRFAGWKEIWENFLNEH